MRLCFLWVVAWAMLFLQAPAWARDGITVLLSEEGGVYADFATQLRAAMDKAGQTRTPLRVVTLASRKSEDPALQAQLLVAVGTPAMTAVSQKHLGTPVLNVLVAHNSFRNLTRSTPRTQDTRVFSAIFFDQPWTRQFALIRHAIPGRRVGILLGKESAELGASLQAAAREEQMTASIEVVNDEADLLAALKRLLPNSDALLAVPDSSIYNRDSISTILLTSYRAKVPLFGFSPSYVKAGALAAVYSQPAHIAQQAAESIQTFLTSGSLPPPQSPRYFSVSVNPQVRLSLEITMDDETRLASKLKPLSEGGP